MAADDVAAGVGRVALGAPVNGGWVLAAAGDQREVVADPKAGYYGITVTERTLVPDDSAQLGEIRLDDWLRQSTATKAAGV